MEMKVIIIWFVNHNVTLVRLELEVADAVKVHVHEDVGEHALNEIGPDIAAVVILAAQSFSDVPNEVPQINGGQFLLQTDRCWCVSIITSPFLNLIAEFLQFTIIINKGGHGVSCIVLDGGNCFLSFLFLLQLILFGCIE